MDLRFWRKPKANESLHNIHHSIFSGQIEEAFKSKQGIQYYRFAKEITMPYGRYQMVQTYFLEYELRLSYKLFKQYIQTIKDFVNVGKLDKILETTLKMEARGELAFSPDQAYNLASIVYFDETEDLYKYDMAYNKKKIAHWKEDGDLGFFFTSPLDELLGLKNFSEQDLADYIKVADQILTDLTSDTH